MYGESRRLVITPITNEAQLVRTFQIERRQPVAGAVATAAVIVMRRYRPGRDPSVFLRSSTAGRLPDDDQPSSSLRQ